MTSSPTVRRAVIVIAVALGLGACEAGSPVPSETEGQDGKSASNRHWTVTHVYDGDSMEVQRDGVVEDVRVIGIDTPERGECGADVAREAAQTRLLGAEVTLVSGAETDRDTYGRLLRYVEVVGEDYGLAMIADRLAIARYDSRSDQPHERERPYRELDLAVEHRCADFDGAAG
ncbi:thermonuclease family protein [Demequina sp. SO4-13]|uniref:thermonuclease family protein n=1 Tax=Demequina sp. SO4-13 TaxID=3401027 RepID=UPI003AF6BB58